MPSSHHHHTHGRAGMYGLARHAGTYARWARLLAGPLYRRVVSDVAAARLPDGAVVLDVGTGPGVVPLMISRRCPDISVSGVDLSPEMITQARASAAVRADPGAARASLSFQVADVVALPFDDQSVDLVVSSLSMHHWEDRTAGLRDIVRVLRPGAEAWVYDVRPMVRRAGQTRCSLDAYVRIETPLAGSLPLNPIGRLVLARHPTTDTTVPKERP